MHQDIKKLRKHIMLPYILDSKYNTFIDQKTFEQNEVNIVTANRALSRIEELLSKNI